MLVMCREVSSGHDSFDFVDMLKNASSEFSTKVHVESDVTCVNNSIAIGCNAVECYVCLSNDSIVA